MKKVFKIKVMVDYLVNVEFERILWFGNKSEDLSYSITKDYYVVAENKKSDKVTKLKESINTSNKLFMKSCKYYFKSDMLWRNKYFSKKKFHIVDEKLDNIVFKISEPQQITIAELKDKLSYKDYLTLYTQKKQ